MNFFQQQDHARRQTRTLIILFVLAVIAILAAVNGAMALVWSWTTTGYVLGMQEYPRGFFATNTLITLTLISVGTMIEMFNLREGGEAVAKMAGGRLVSPSTTDLQERRLLNVVEEMALASGIACPRVYLLDREEGINAFAAGYNQNEAVVAVTRGMLVRLTRDELQGVVAHEFSHILNGDMRLNIRLIGLLFGIQMIAGFGQHLIDFSTHAWNARERNDKGPSARMMLLATGVALLVIGYIGVFFGRLIKAAVSRQREFLADASAVQFTRNPDGIGGALRKIGGLSKTMRLGSRIDHPNAEQLSHLFLGAPRPNMLSGLLATHPPIEERLRRIFGREVELLETPALPEESRESADVLPDIPYVAAGFAQETPPAHWLATGSGGEARIALPPALDNAVREPAAAGAVVCALLLANGDEREVQVAILKQEAARHAALVPFLANSIAALPRSARLPLLDLCMPALKQLSGMERTQLLSTVDKLIAADNKFTLAEFVLQTVLVRRMDPHAGRSAPVRYARLAELNADCAVLMSLVAHVASPSMKMAPGDLFARGATLRPETGLSAEQLMDVRALDYAKVRNALERAHQLAPLVKPVLIKMLLAASGESEPLPTTVADLLRAMCAALEVPVPPAVADTYTNYHW